MIYFVLNVIIETFKKNIFCTFPRFLLQFSLSGSAIQGSGVLDVVETNPFKHLIHLSLNFLPGNDQEIKKYLAKCLKELKVRIFS